MLPYDGSGAVHLNNDQVWINYGSNITSQNTMLGIEGRWSANSDDKLTSMSSVGREEPEPTYEFAVLDYAPVDLSLYSQLDKQYGSDEGDGDAALSPWLGEQTPHTKYTRLTSPLIGDVTPLSFGSSPDGRTWIHGRMSHYDLDAVSAFGNFELGSRFKTLLPVVVAWVDILWRPWRYWISYETDEPTPCGVLIPPLRLIQRDDSMDYGRTTMDPTRVGVGNEPTTSQHGQRILWSPSTYW